jgi:hypothetical protein
MKLARTLAAAAITLVALWAAAPDSFARGGGQGGAGGGGGGRAGADGTGDAEDSTGVATFGAMGEGMGQSSMKPGGMDFAAGGEESKEILRDVYLRFARDTYGDFRSDRNDRTSDPGRGR